MEVRPATAADVDGIQRVATRSWHAAHDAIAGVDAVDEFLDEYYTRERLRGHVADPSRPFLVAAAGEVVGFALVVPHDDDPGLFALASIYVHPDEWGAGVGTRLLDRAERAARARGGDRLRLGVMAANDRAVGFYESRDYERVGVDRDERLDVERYTYAKGL